MDSLREVIHLLASSFPTSSKVQGNQALSRVTPQTTSCLLVPQLFHRPIPKDSTIRFANVQSGDSSQYSVSTDQNTSNLSTTSTTPSKVVPADFPSFSQLPVELRRSIWRHATSSIEGRIISIEPDDAFEDAGRGFRCVARARLPSLLVTCSESRAESLREYQLKFHAQLRHPIYYNKHKDTILMSRTGSMFSFLQSTYEFERLTHDEFDRDQVLSLALLVNDAEVNFWGEDSLHGYPSWRQVSMAAITFSNVRELRLIYRSENDEYTPGFQREKATLGLFWSRHWSNWQQLRARALLATQNLVLDLKSSVPPDFVYWSREQLESSSPDVGRWVPENLHRRSRGSPEPLYGRNQTSFFSTVS